MSIAVFLIMLLVSAGIVVYPLLSKGQRAGLPNAVGDADIDRALRKMRPVRPQAGLACPYCGRSYQAGDQFCVQCGEPLPEKAVVRGPVCPACGASVHEGDLFCAKCGAQVSGEEAA
jgi:predicted amidophosphoribosyltransferase